MEYVKGRISEEAGYEVAFTLADPLTFTTDPAMRPILEEACWFCWEAYRKDYHHRPSGDNFSAIIAVVASSPSHSWTQPGRSVKSPNEMRCDHPLLAKSVVSGPKSLKRRLALWIDSTMLVSTTYTTAHCENMRGR